MAEERLIDDDKDKKYKIRINEDGEEELYIDETPEAEEPEPEETLDFEVPEFDGDDEEAAVMTPEQLAARDRARAEAETRRINELNARVEHAKKLILEGKFDDSLYVLDEAQDFGDDGRVFALRVEALTKNYSDFTRAEEGLKALDGVLSFSADEQKREFSPADAGLKEKRAELKEKTDGLKTEYGNQRAERQERYLKKRKTALILFTVTAVPTLLFAVLAGYFGSIMHSQMDHNNMISCFVFIGACAVFFIATLFTAHGLWESAKLIKMNKSTSSSKLGRELEKYTAELAFIEKIIFVYGLEDDISR